MDSTVLKSVTLGLDGPDKCHAVTPVDQELSRLGRSATDLISATVAVDGALHTTGLTAGFAWVLHVAARAVPLLTLLEPQHWESAAVAGLSVIGMPGKRHALSIEHEISDRRVHRTLSANRIS